MCGIAGIYGKYLPELEQKITDSFFRSLAHRGPDGRGKFQNESISLIHTRLSIIDLSEHGNQPLFNEDKTLVLICNGEIYNYKELRQELLNKNHKLSSDSDCETILHLYEEYPDDPEKLISRLTGMFAFALWDTKRKRLLIARDRLGIKPLYYTQFNNSLVFASEVKPIAASQIMKFTVDHTSLYEYFLTGSIPGPNTLFNEVKALEPGHYMLAEDSKITIKQYWDVVPGSGKWKNEEEVVGGIDHLLSGIVKDHLVADVPVGTFLSAGVDSSLITSYAADFHPAIHTFTASFPGEPEDEGLISGNTAGRLKTTHHSYKLAGNFFEGFDEQFSKLDQPFAISSALSLGRISKLACGTIKVVLSGDGGDELFLGYSRHQLPQYPSFLKYIPASLRDVTLKYGAVISGKKNLEALRQNLKIPDVEKYLYKYQVLHKNYILPLFSPEVRKHIDTERYIARLKNCYQKFETEDKLNQLLYVDIKTTLVDEMLTKCDRMTMINGIEGRVPFLDHRLVELAFSIPSPFKKNDNFGKLPLRKILAKRLGDELAYRTKTGFNAPLKKWLQEDKETADFARSHLKNADKLDFLNKSVIQNSIERFHEMDTAAVFSLICLNKYIQQA